MLKILRKKENIVPLIGTTIGLFAVGAAVTMALYPASALAVGMLSLGFTPALLLVAGFMLFAVCAHWISANSKGLESLVKDFVSGQTKKFLDDCQLKGAVIYQDGENFYLNIRDSDYRKELINSSGDNSGILKLKTLSFDQSKQAKMLKNNVIITVEICNDNNISKLKITDIIKTKRLTDNNINILSDIKQDFFQDGRKELNVHIVSSQKAERDMMDNIFNDFIEGPIISSIEEQKIEPLQIRNNSTAMEL
ncbi:hypothetical protein [Wolbachia endosymbiont of Pentidionis agamae]|uniref:hypothetical protein n=1 Tax=Wolbachia endosymbiont of Pentidionis agamae TaxID=3110435 RepID=UPI002FD55C26